MELERQTIHKSKQVGTAFAQITLDDDYNLPDYKPDLAKVIRERGQLEFEEIHINNGHILVRGLLKFQILYRTDLDGRKLNYLRGEIPFQESLSMDEVEENDTIHMEGKIEDISVSVINSRKLSIRALAEIKAAAERQADVPLLIGTGSDTSCMIERAQEEVLELVMQKNDSLRIRKELSIASNKPNMEEILWSSVELRGIDSHLNTGNIEVSGEAFVQVLYLGAEDEERLQWFETTVPIQGSLECEQCEKEQVHHIVTELFQVNLEMAQDEDGEERNLALEIVLKMQMYLWKAETIEMVTDMYALDREIETQIQNSVFERLLVKNESKCKVSEKIALEQDLEDAVQICMQEASVSIEQQQITDKGVLAEGTLTADILYLTAEETLPVNTKRVYVPFSQVLEMPKTNLPLTMYADAHIEQMSTVLTDSRSMEVKAVITLSLLAFEKQELPVITEVTEKETDLKTLQQRPGIVGYIVKEGDRLFGIAKNYHTTEQSLMEMNGLTDKRIKKGEKLLIVKEVS